MASRVVALEEENAKLVAEMASMKKKIMVHLKKQQAELQAKVQAAESRAAAAEAALASARLDTNDRSDIIITTEEPDGDASVDGNASRSSQTEISSKGPWKQVKKLKAELEEERETNRKLEEAATVEKQRLAAEIEERDNSCVHCEGKFTRVTCTSGIKLFVIAIPFLVGCPACLRNFLNLFCELACSPNQSLFINVTSISQVKCVDFAMAIVYILLVFAIFGWGFLHRTARSNKASSRMKPLLHTEEENELRSVNRSEHETLPVQEQEEVPISKNGMRMPFIQGYISKFYRKHGMWVARNPSLVLAVSIVIVLFLCLGLFRLDVETRPEKLWVGPGSKAAEEKEFFDTHLAPFYRIEQHYTSSEPCLSAYQAPLDPSTILGGFTGSSHSQATAFVTTYPVSNAVDKTGNENGKATAWEKSFIRLAKEELVPMAHSHNLTLRESTADIVTILVLLGLSGVLVVVLSVLGSIGLFSVFGVKSTLIIVEVIPFLVLAISRAALAPDSSYIARPAASWLDDFLVWISPEAFGCCRKFTNGTYCPPDDQPPCCPAGEDYCGISETCKDCTTCFLHSDLVGNRPSTTQFREKLPWFLNSLPSADCAKGGHGEGYENGVIRASEFRTYHTPLNKQSDFVNAMRAAREFTARVSDSLKVSDGDEHNEQKRHSQPWEHPSSGFVECVWPTLHQDFVG